MIEHTTRAFDAGNFAATLRKWVAWNPEQIADAIDALVERDTALANVS